MRRITKALAATAVVLVVGAAPALAQYAPDETTTTTRPTTTTTRPTTTTSRPPSSTTSTTDEPATTTTEAPPPAREEVTSNKEEAAPGEAVTLGGGTSSDEPLAQEDEEVEVTLSPASNGVSVQPVVRQLTDAEGNVTGLEVTMPEDTPTGLYFIQVVVTRPNGEARVLITPIVVRNPDDDNTTDTTDPEQLRGQAGVDFWVDQPLGTVSPKLLAIQATITSAGEEAAIVAAVVEDHAQVSVIDGELVVSRSLVGDAETDETRPLVAALAVGLAGGGLVLVRRRTPAALKGRK